MAFNRSRASPRARDVSPDRRLFRPNAMVHLDIPRALIPTDRTQDNLPNLVETPRSQSDHGCPGRGYDWLAICATRSEMARTRIVARTFR